MKLKCINEMCGHERIEGCVCPWCGYQMAPVDTQPEKVRSGEWVDELEAERDRLNKLMLRSYEMGDDELESDLTEAWELLNKAHDRERSRSSTEKLTHGG